MNPFQQLREEEIQEFVALRQDRVRRRVNDRLRTLQFYGDILDLFTNKLADTATTLNGGEPSLPDSEYRTILDNDTLGPGDDPDLLPPAGPEDRDEIIR